MTFGLTNTSSQTWPEVGLDQDNGWIELRLTLSADGEIKQRACLGIYENLSPGTTTEISMPVELPVDGGTYDGVAELVQLGVGTLGPSAQFRLVIEENPIFGGLNRLLPGWCSTDVPEWKQVPGLGKIKVDQYPWIYHPEHGWQYIHEESSQPGKLTLHDEHMGWLYVQLQNYPENIQCLQDKTWVRYDGTRDGLRTFVRKDSGQQLEVPKNKGKAKP